jgi:hypothetical protein
LRYQPDDRGVPTSLTWEIPLPHYPTVEISLPDSPDELLSLNFCREKLKKKIELFRNDHESLRFNHNFAMCMHALATFHRSFGPIELVDNKGYFYPCHGQHPYSGQFWKARECLTFCVKSHRRGLVRYCDTCHKKRKSFLQLDKREEDRLMRNDNQLLEGLKQEGSSTRPYTTMTPQSAKK